MRELKINGRRRLTPAGYINPVTLIALALVAIVYGALYFIGDFVDFEGESVRLVTFVGFPTTVYGWLWLAIGVVAAFSLYNKNVFRYAYAALTAMFFVWAALFAVDYATGGVDAIGSLLTSASWGALALSAHTLSVIELTDNKTEEAVVDAAIAAVSDVVEDELPEGEGAK